MAEPAVVSARCAQPWLGTLVEIAAAGSSRERVDDAIAAGFAAIAAVHRALSGHAADSELAHVNRTAAHAPQMVSIHVREVLGCALDIARCSGGVFDPTVGNELAALGYLPSRCGQRFTASWRDVHLAGNRVRFARKPESSQTPKTLTGKTSSFVKPPCGGKPEWSSNLPGGNIVDSHSPANYSPPRKQGGCKT